MQRKKTKLSLFIFIDAFGWNVMQRHPEFLKGLIQDSRPLETILGYSSACDPSIISGLTPSEHGLWNSFFLDPENSPFTWTRPLCMLPDAVFRRSRVRNLLSRWIKRKCGFTGYFQLYAVPFKYLHLFNYAEQKRIWAPGGLPRGRSVFDLMKEKDIAYYVHDSDASDEMRLQQLMSDIQNRRIDFAYCSLGRLDALMHAEGNDSPNIGGLLEWYDVKIRSVLDAAEENYEEVVWHLFTDHGMHNVTETYDLQADVDSLGLEWERDYAACYDATMLRIWFLTDTGRESIVRLLSNHPKGHILSETELKTFGVYFEDGKYGEVIFLMNAGIQIVPSFMGVKPVKGMHGYHPTDPDSLACIASNKSIPGSITRIQHIHQLMLSELGISPGAVARTPATECRPG